MARYVADEKCFVGDALHQPGDVFEFDGPEGSAFHMVGKPKKPKLNEERKMDAAVTQHKPWEAEKALLLREIDRLKNTIALRDIAIHEAGKWMTEKASLSVEIQRLNGIIDQKNRLIKQLR